MNTFIIIISLFFGIFAKSTFAEEKFVTIETIPSDQEIIIGQTFPVNVTIETNIINRTFYYLFYGGIGNTTIQTRGEDGPILSFTDDPYDWDNLPTFTTDMSGNWYLEANNAYINPNTPAGTYSLFLKIILPELDSDDIADSFISDPQPITVKAFSSTTITPTVITTPTPTPTLIPFPTITPIPTAIISFPTATPTSRNQIPTLTPTPTININIFGVTTESTSSATPTTSVEPISLPTEASSSTFIEVGSNPPEIKLSSPPKKISLIPFIVLTSISSLSMIFFIFLKIKKR